MESGQELKQELKEESMKELCLLTEVYFGACPASFLLYKPDSLA